MNKILLLLFGLFACQVPLQGQILNPKDTAKRKATDRTNSTIDRGIDRGLDKVEEGISNLFKKKEKSIEPATAPNSTSTSPKNSSSGGSGWDEPGGTPSVAPSNEVSQPTAPNRLSASSKFDFIPGEKVIALEDFSQDEVGDFPAKWNTNASGEIIQLSGISGKFLKPASEGIFFPEFVDKLPDLFTLEFDMFASDDLSEMMSGLGVKFVEISERNLRHDILFSKAMQANLDIHPTNSGDEWKRGTSYVFISGASEEVLMENQIAIPWRFNEVNRISIWRQKNRLRMYINETKIWDLPRAFQPNSVYGLMFTTRLFNGFVAFSNLRLAVGAPDTRAKLITEGKFSTNGILFDVNSDRIRPESAGVLKDISQVLKDNPTVKVKIIGHTDSDGADLANLTLSQKRAASVKKALSADYSIPADRMETDGKGESQPIDSNATPQGKANNRRVEFIKL